MSPRPRSLSPRDQSVSPFSAILLRLCDAVSALGAALVDGEGETVDYAGSLDPFDIKIAAAEGALLFSVVKQGGVPAWLETEELVVRGRTRGLCLIGITEGYAVVLVLPQYAFSISPRAKHEAVRDLCNEAGLDPPGWLASSHERWVRVEVQTKQGDRLRPESVWIHGRWCDLELLGRIAGANRREVGFRARLETGAEINLVRERLGRWYADEPLQ